MSDLFEIVPAAGYACLSMVRDLTKFDYTIDEKILTIEKMLETKAVGTLEVIWVLKDEHLDMLADSSVYVIHANRRLSVKLRYELKSRVRSKLVKEEKLVEKLEEKLKLYLRSKDYLDEIARHTVRLNQELEHQLHSKLIDIAKAYKVKGVEYALEGRVDTEKLKVLAGKARAAEHALTEAKKVYGKEAGKVIDMWYQDNPEYVGDIFAHTLKQVMFD